MRADPIAPHRRLPISFAHHGNRTLPLM
jgi:hypothetical protein